jgi:hypothetical protein
MVQKGNVSSSIEKEEFAEARKSRDTSTRLAYRSKNDFRKVGHKKGRRLHSDDPAAIKTVASAVSLFKLPDPCHSRVQKYTLDKKLYSSLATFALNTFIFCMI